MTKTTKSPKNHDLSPQQMRRWFNQAIDQIPELGVIDVERYFPDIEEHFPRFFDAPQSEFLYAGWDFAYKDNSILKIGLSTKSDTLIECLHPEFYCLGALSGNITKRLLWLVFGLDHLTGCTLNRQIMGDRLTAKNSFEFEWLQYNCSPDSRSEITYPEIT